MLLWNSTSFQIMYSAIVAAIIVTACAEYLDTALPTRKVNLPGAEPKISQTIKCLQQQHPCVSKGLLPHSDGKCYVPLERGPCPRGHVIMLDTDSAANGLKGHCKEQRCLSGLVPLKERCLPHAQVRTLFCATGKLHLDPTGNPICGEFPGWKNLLLSYVRCPLRRKRQVKWTGRSIPNKRVTWVHNALCSVGNNGNCGNSVTGVNPNVILAPEN